ncbi:MAG: hypothetical protein COA42_03220 [Alteromonadaceae bacterium]|nr:MAG: hypothetical protein COA42_03220 [Alteromonadaceae bacterium]
MKVVRVSRPVLSKRLLLGHLRLYLAMRERVWRQNRQDEFRLLILAGVFFILGVLVFSVEGYVTGFIPVQRIGLALLPQAVWENITFFGDALVAMVVVLLFSYRHPRIVIVVLASLLVGTICIHGLKALLQVSRPAAVFGEHAITVIGPALKYGSMPSGHTATVFILASLLCRCTRLLSAKVLIFTMAAVVACSRVVCGAHWPVDVFFGASVGLVVVWACLRFTQRIPLSVGLYGGICTLLVACGLYLYGFDGGFTYTKTTSELLAFAVLFYWFFSWVLELGFRPLIRQRRKLNLSV